MKFLQQEGQGAVIADVIDAGICVRCGACVGICPYFDYSNGKVVVMDRCHAEPSRCFQMCPLF
jgi:coenzyme F420 hydrogenase subunit beta